MKMSRPQALKSAPKRQKNRLTEDQLRILEASFNQEKKLEPERKFQLSYQLGMPAKQVAIWYQNKRARWKNQNIELDYRTVQIRLDNALADKGRLQREVIRLREELQKANEAITSLNFSGPSISSLSTSCDEEGSPSLPNNMDNHWQNSQGLQVDDLYACLIGTGDQTSFVSNNYSLFNP